MDKGLDIYALRVWLAAHAALYASPRRLNKLLRTCLRGAPHQHWNASHSRLLLDSLAFAGVGARWDLADRALTWARSDGREIITLASSRYPRALREIACPPPVLFLEGAARALDRPQIAIVGSRKASRASRDFAYQLARELVDLGAGITSGLAYGIDAAGHEGALAARGWTAAVFGCGIDRVYPVRHRALSERVRGYGVLVSEFPLGTPPRGIHFPQRNRLISGLSIGTVVVAAAERSGSIITARYALEQGREVFAVPGAVRDPFARGCHELIKQGAKLTASITDLTEEFPFGTFGADPATIDISISKSSGDNDLPLQAHEAAALNALGWAPFTIDEMVECTALTAQEVSSMLSSLELCGMIEVQASGTYIRVR